MRLPPNLALASGVVLPLAAVATALYTQHVLGMQPCPWCVLQRALFVAIALASVLGLLLRHALPRRGAALLMLVLAGCGIAAALWQHFVAAASASCNLSFADRVMGATGLDNWLPEVFAAYASCADGAALLLGISYEFYSLTLFALLALTAVALLRKPA